MFNFINVPEGVAPTTPEALPTVEAIAKKSELKTGGEREKERLPEPLRVSVEPMKEKSEAVILVSKTPSITVKGPTLPPLLPSLPPKKVLFVR